MAGDCEFWIEECRGSASLVVRICANSASARA